MTLGVWKPRQIFNSGFAKLTFEFHRPIRAKFLHSVRAPPCHSWNSSQWRTCRFFELRPTDAYATQEKKNAKENAEK